MKVHNKYILRVFEENNDVINNTLEVSQLGHSMVGVEPSALMIPWSEVKIPHSM